MDTLTDRVRLGVAWLDENYDGWRDRVSINDLNLRNECKCVLGQLFEPQARLAGVIFEGDGIGFSWAVEHIEVLAEGDAHRYGFDLYDGDFAGYGDDDIMAYADEWRKLQRLWERVLKGETL